MVGTPSQWVDVFVSTGSQETWVVGSGGCDGSKSFHVEVNSSRLVFKQSPGMPEQRTV